MVQQRNSKGYAQYPWPLPARKPRPSDWGFGMTICIGAITAKHEIITVSDQMLSMSGGAFTAESVALKEELINRDWSLMFAGDVAVVPSLLRRIERQVGSYSKPTDVQEISDVISTSFQEERRERATELYLKPYGIALERFLLEGDSLFGASGAAVIRDRIERHELGCELIIVGHTGKAVREAHILSCQDPGIAKDHNITSYWAIGSGAYLALSSLAIRQHSGRYSLQSCVCHILEAKFTAEMAVGVGRQTFVMVRKPDRSWTSMENGELDFYRKEWKRAFAPREPKRAVRQAGIWLEGASWFNKPDQPQVATPADALAPPVPTDAAKALPPSRE